MPLFTDKRLSLTDSKSLKRAPKADVYKQIEADLTAAIAVLPPSQIQKGRITKYAAQALLGKVYLYQNKFDAAATMLDNVINANAFSLVQNFGNIFLLSGENGSESVLKFSTLMLLLIITGVVQHADKVTMRFNNVVFVVYLALLIMHQVGVRTYLLRI